MALEVGLTLCAKVSLLMQKLVDCLQSLLKAAAYLVNFGYWLAGEPNISVPDLTGIASVGIEVPIIADFIRAYSEHPLCRFKMITNLMYLGELLSF